MSTAVHAAAPQDTAPLDSPARKACAAVAWLVRALVLLLTAVMLLALGWQVFMRYVFDKAPSWSEELALGCFTWSMLLAIALGVRDAIHVRMDLLVDHLPGPLRTAADKFSTLAVAAVGGFVCWAGVGYTLDTAGATSAAIGYPIEWLHAAAPACGALVAFFALERLVLGAPSKS